MPEGHTIHRIAQDHRRDYLGKTLQSSSPQGRFSNEAEAISGKRLNAIEAHGKHLCYQFGRGVCVHIHLGLYGKFRPLKAPFGEPRGQVRWRLLGSRNGFDLNGPNCCELITKSDWESIQGRLGPDPLREDADPELVWASMQKSRAPIGALLLNQRIVSGVGNVYRCEVLHLLHIHPERPARELTRDEFDQLWAMLKRLLKIGVRYNRIIINDPAEIGKPRSKMTRDERLRIYKQPNCPNCDAPIKTWELGARRMYACMRCQAA